MRQLITIAFLFICFLSYGQKEAWHWYFGNKAGLDFSSGTPVPDLNGDMFTREGVASISDAAGNLLFYTDGDTVWDRTHNLMPNGTGLLGDGSSTQSSIIVPRPGTTHIYYIFTVPATCCSGDGLNYSEVDMTLNGGLGAVVASEKNILLHTPVTEKLTGVLHANGVDFWVLAHELNSADFVAFEVTNAGVNTTAVISTVGAVYGNGGVLGSIKSSPDGSKVASVLFSDQILEVHDFNNATGVLSNPLSVTSGFTAGLYSCEFSPDGSKVYASEFGSNIYQIDLNAGTQAQIIASLTNIFTGTPSIGTMQTGPDQKIYFTHEFADFLGGINEPNELGVACDAVDTAVFLGGRIGRLGLPNFLVNFFNANFSFTGICLGDTTFFIADTVGVTSMLWNFDDTASGTNDTSSQFFPFHIFTDTGTYNVRLIAHFDTVADTVFQQITIHPYPTVNLGNDTSFCQGGSVVLDAAFPGASYLWSDTSTADSLFVDTAGTYWVSVFNVCDTVFDTVNVSIDQNFAFDLGPDTTLCEGTPYLFDPNIAIDVDYLWHDGSTNDTFLSTASDTVILVATNACDTATDTAVTNFLSIPNIQLGPDTFAYTADSMIFLAPVLNGVNFVWSDGSMGDSLVVDTSGTYWLQGSNLCGQDRDSIIVEYLAFPDISLGNDTTICNDSSLLLDVTFTNATYFWPESNTTDATFLVEEEGDYSVLVTLGQCTTIDTITVLTEPDVCPDGIDCHIEFPNVFTPNEDGFNDEFRPLVDCDLISYTLSIYNRWGVKVYVSKHDNIGWDGAFNGVPAAAGTYYWTIDFEHQVVVDQDRKGTTGFFTLLR